MSTIRFSIPLFFALVVVATSGSAPAQQAAPESSVKAVNLIKFGLYVTWPEKKLKTFTIGVLGDDPVGPALEEIARIKKTFRGKPIVIHRFEKVEDYKPCQMLFVSSPERLEPMLKRLRDAPVLVVTDSAGLAKRGSMINFFIEKDTVKFEINHKAAKRVGLEVDSRLLQLAQPAGSSD